MQVFQGHMHVEIANEQVAIVLTEEETKLLNIVLLNSGINTEPLTEEEDAVISTLWSTLKDAGY
jgi:hypothetical protein